MDEGYRKEVSMLN